MTGFVVFAGVFLFFWYIIISAAAKYDANVLKEKNEQEEFRKKKAMYLQPIPGSGTGPSANSSDKHDEKAFREQSELELLRKKKAMFLQPLPGSGTGHSRSKK
ncbi:hypothetical protein [uncultured Alteromonas sp.]|uniref:hypothetical protein n=1 Tax=uncultured Alteromonas sp. TaxID=179113 RepID=UPI0030CEB3AD|tara:strand:- start:896 stop:1204 length:309 start_codon:yes stop_codon:yes gene_type:complete